MRSTERLPEDEAPATYADLGDPRFEGRLCLRTSDSVYNSSFVADQIAKEGRAATERMLRAWMANDPTILGSDVDVLEAIEAGRCDVGLTNHYYLGRILEDDPDFPVAPVWAEPGRPRRAREPVRRRHHALLGQPCRSRASSSSISSSKEAQELFASTNSEFPANPTLRCREQIADWRGFRVDPIDVTSDAGLQADAVELMNEVGWR